MISAFHHQTTVGDLIMIPALTLCVAIMLEVFGYAKWFSMEVRLRVGEERTEFVYNGGRK